MIRKIDEWFAQGRRLEDIFRDGALRKESCRDNFEGIENNLLIQPLFQNNQLREVIIVVDSMRSIANIINVMREFYIYSFIIALLLGAGLSFVYSRIIAKPLLTINATAVKMAQLDFTAKLPVKSHDEIGSLAHSLNQLSENLRQSFDELQQANEQLKADIEKEKALDKARKEFIANASHELKTPLGVLQGFAEGLQDGIDEEKKQHYLEILIDETEKMNHLVEELLEHSRVESDTFRLNIEDFSINQLLSASVLKSIHFIKEKDLEVHYSHLEQEIIVRADKPRIEQVITNILSNAIRHTPENGIISIGLEDADKQVRVLIENTGENIPEAALTKIWDPFYRVDKARARKSGGLKPCIWIRTISPPPTG